MLFERAFHLEGADAVARADNHIICSPDEPEVAVLVFIGAIARDVPIAAHAAVGGIRVAPVLLEHPDGSMRLNPHRYIAFFTGRQFAAVVIDDAYIEAGRGFAHRAGFDLQRREVGAEQHRLRLSVAVADGHAGDFLPDFDDLWIERLARAYAVTQRLWRVGLEIGHWLVKHQHTIGGGRRAQRGD